MNHTVVRYTVKPGQEQLNEQLIRGVYTYIDEARPAGLGYSTFKLDDGRTFVHVASWDGDFPLAGTSAFRAFREGLAERCETGPDVRPAALVGSADSVCA